MTRYGLASHMMMNIQEMLKAEFQVLYLGDLQSLIGIQIKFGPNFLE
jgi:hypothetical protein